VRYSTILFDIGDTLLRVPDPAPYYQTLLSRYGVALGLEGVRRILHETRCTMDERIPRWVSDDFVLDREASARRRALHVETVIALAGIEDRSAARDAFFSIYTGTEFFTVFPEVRATLAELRARGYRLGVVSNWETRLPTLCAAHGIDTYLDFAVISEVEGYAKPHPHLYRRALELAQTSADRVVHVGDKLREDVEGAAQVGIRGILIDRGIPPATDFSPQIASLADLIPLLEAT
jgi:putative hydrolase of the HAD superfamily